MASPDLVAAATELARLAVNPTSTPGDRSMRNAAKTVLSSVPNADKATVKKAVRVLATGVKSARGPHADVLHLTLGALVEEAGAPAEIAWPVLADGLVTGLTRATKFGVAVVRAAKTQVVADALAAKGAEVAAKMPEEARAWQELPARCLAAAACLSRSPKLREEARAAGLRKKADALSMGVAEVAQVVQLLDAMEDEEVVVLHPGSKRGYVVRASDLTMNAELVVLLAHALCGDPRKGKLAGEKPSAGAVKALRNQGGRRGKPVRAPATFELLPWDSVDAGGELDARDHDHDHGLDLSGSPTSIPKTSGKRVVLLRDPDHLHAIEIEPPPGALAPTVLVERELSEKEVATWLGKLASRAHPSARPPTPAATKPAKKAGGAAPKASAKKKR